MSFPDVLKRGDTFLREYPRDAWWWNYASHAACFGVILNAKVLLNLMYTPKLHNIERLDAALAKARAENRSLLTVMNHMSVVDDPTFYAALPWRFHFDIDTIRWGFGADNVCFLTPLSSYFFNLGKILGTKRFGEGPFQGSVDAAIRILSPDDTLDLEYTPGVAETSKPTLLQEFNLPEPNNSKLLVKYVKPLPETTNCLMSKSPFIRTKTSWFHVFPEGFVLQLEEPHNNSMRYFKWGVSRLILEATTTPVVVPIFSFGFEKISPESTAEEGIKRWLPNNFGAEVHMAFGEPVPDELLESYRADWRKLVKKHIDPQNPSDMPETLKTGTEAQELRSNLAAELRDKVLSIRSQLGYFEPEDPRFRDHQFWKEYTSTEGLSDPDVKFIGKNWAVRRFQKHLPEYREDDE